jgi:malate synthase
MRMPTPPLDAYDAFLPGPLIAELARQAEAVEAVPGLALAPGLRARFPELLSDDALRFVVQLFHAVAEPLDARLKQRVVDRAFLDATTAACRAANRTCAFSSGDYATAIGKQDEKGRVVLGPIAPPTPPRSVTIPPFLRGTQVTLFGPPDSAKMTINAMNSLHRRLPGEAPIVAELIDACGEVPSWGADSEDSKTPTAENLLTAQQNLRGCFAGNLTFDDPHNGKHYALAEHGLARPIKRFPGLAIPDGSTLLDGRPLPFHVVDFGLHLFHNWNHSKGLVFYVPKLENEEEAAYLHGMIHHAEAMIQALHPSYQLGTVRTVLVFENPRAIFRIAAMAEALHPYFLGGSLGWHDYLASAARLFKNDPNYRIPVKADPNIVINHIRESHQILVDALAPIGALKIGGMYGVLYEDGNPASFEVSMVGYIKDVVTQMKRGLDGFWVAHPSFVRIGIALVEAWRRHVADPTDGSLTVLVTSLVPNPGELDPLLAFIAADDVRGLPADHPNYARGVLAADIQVSDMIRNDDPEEVRYNIFQALQYITDWLGGNGCVALPATLTNRAGETVFVRVMDDLATTERSRWELWHELHYGRVSRHVFETILAEEVAFLRGDQATPTKRVQVRWAGEAARWYPVAIDLLRRLVLDPDPPEFASELMLPFTFSCVRDAADPIAAAEQLGLKPAPAGV